MLFVIFAQLNKYWRIPSFSCWNHTITDSRIPAGEVDKMENSVVPERTASFFFFEEGDALEIMKGAVFSIFCAFSCCPENPV